MTHGSVPSPKVAQKAAETGCPRARAMRPRSSWRASHTTYRTLPCAAQGERQHRPQPCRQSPRTTRARPASRRRAVAHRTVVRDKGKEIGSVLAPPQRSRAAPWGIEGESQMLECAGIGHSLAPRRRPAMRVEKEGFQASTRRLPS